MEFEVEILWKFVFERTSFTEHQYILDKISKEQMYFELVDELTKMKRDFLEEHILKLEFEKIKANISLEVFEE